MTTKDERSAGDRITSEPGTFRVTLASGRVLVIGPPKLSSETEREAEARKALDAADDEDADEAEDEDAT